jgi:hypothetical protein
MRLGLGMNSTVEFLNLEHQRVIMILVVEALSLRTNIALKTLYMSFGHKRRNHMLPRRNEVPDALRVNESRDPSHI